MWEIDRSGGIAPAMGGELVVCCLMKAQREESREIIEVN